MKPAKLTFVGVFFAISLSGVRADWRLGAETGAFYESNLSNSDRTSDAKDDWAWRSEVRIGNGFQLSRDLRLSLGGDLRGQVWGRFGAFNQIGPGFSADLRYRFGLGRRAPWVALEERIGYDRFQEEGRSNWDESLRLRGGIALSDRIALEAGYEFENRAASADFFNEQSHSVNARLIVDVTPSLQVALGYTYRDGDVISYAIPPRPDIVMLASELRPVTTFGAQPLYTAYRLRGQTHVLSLSAAYTLTRYLSAQCTYLYSTTSHDSLRYENHAVEAKIAFAY